MWAVIEHADGSVIGLTVFKRKAVAKRHFRELVRETVAAEDEGDGRVRDEQDATMEDIVADAVEHGFNFSSDGGVDILLLPAKVGDK